MVNLLFTIICLYLYHDIYSLYYTMVTRVYVCLLHKNVCYWRAEAMFILCILVTNSNLFKNRLSISFF